MSKNVKIEMITEEGSFQPMVRVSIDIPLLYGNENVTEEYLSKTRKMLGDAVASLFEVEKENKQ